MKHRLCPSDRPSIAYMRDLQDMAGLSVKSHQAMTAAFFP
jgi:hypothetical protein